MGIIYKINPMISTYFSFNSIPLYTIIKFGGTTKIINYLEMLNALTFYP